MKDDTTPATKADIHRLDTNIQRMDTQIQSMDTRIQSMDARIESMDAEIHRMNGDIREVKGEMREMAKGLHAAIDQVLTVLVNVDKRLTGSVENHERRITRLEARVGIGA
jgi:predicted RNase H-like nuclease (RuvC/YqgF family)